MGFSFLASCPQSCLINLGTQTRRGGGTSALTAGSASCRSALSPLPTGQNWRQDALPRPSPLPACDWDNLTIHFHQRSGPGHCWAQGWESWFLHFSRGHGQALCLAWILSSPVHVLGVEGIPPLPPGRSGNSNVTRQWPSRNLGHPAEPLTSKMALSPQ